MTIKITLSGGFRHTKTPWQYRFDNYFDERTRTILILQEKYSLGMFCPTGSVAVVVGGGVVVGEAAVSLWPDNTFDNVVLETLGVGFVKFWTVDVISAVSSAGGF